MYLIESSNLWSEPMDFFAEMDEKNGRYQKAPKVCSLLLTRTAPRSARANVKERERERARVRLNTGMTLLVNVLTRFS